jgi:uncharacterized damage-inducible protein DinB
MNTQVKNLGVTILAVALLVTIAPARAEEGAESGFMTDFVADLERVGGRLGELAGAVPADKFSWAPNEDVRTVSEVYMHATFVNTFIPIALGAAPPAGLDMPEGTNSMALMQKWEAEITDKDEVIAKMKESFEYAAKAVLTITDLETMVDAFGFPGSKRAYLLILLTHDHEHLGQSIAYARSLGVVPPWTAKQAEGEGGG